MSTCHQGIYFDITDIVRLWMVWKCSQCEHVDKRSVCVYGWCIYNDSMGILTYKHEDLYGDVNAADLFTYNKCGYANDMLTLTILTCNWCGYVEYVDILTGMIIGEHIDRVEIVSL